jgi:hypothetical protein
LALLVSKRHEGERSASAANNDLNNFTVATEGSSESLSTLRACATNAAECETRYEYNKTLSELVLVGSCSLRAPLIYIFLILGSMATTTASTSASTTACTTSTAMAATTITTITPCTLARLHVLVVGAQSLLPWTTTATVTTDTIRACVGCAAASLLLLLFVFFVLLLVLLLASLKSWW